MSEIAASIEAAEIIIPPVAEAVAAIANALATIGNAHNDGVITQAQHAAILDQIYQMLEINQQMLQGAVQVKP